MTTHDGYEFPVAPEPALPEVEIDQHGCMVLTIENHKLVVPPAKLNEFVAMVNERVLE